MTQNDVAPQPRIAADGTPLCQACCPHFRTALNDTVDRCALGLLRITYPDQPCRPAAAALAAEREQMQAEIANLRAALATPEVYAGVVQEQLAWEREAAVARAAAAEAKLSKVRDACKHTLSSVGVFRVGVAADSFDRGRAIHALDVLAILHRKEQP